MPLEAAVRKLAALPAENLGIKRRGRLQAGYFADIAIFDPGIQDHATFDKPRQYPQAWRTCLSTAFRC